MSVAFYQMMKGAMTTPNLWFFLSDLASGAAHLGSLYCLVQILRFLHRPDGGIPGRVTSFLNQIFFYEVMANAFLLPAVFIGLGIRRFAVGILLMNVARMTLWVFVWKLYFKKSRRVNLFYAVTPASASEPAPLHPEK